MKPHPLPKTVAPLIDELLSRWLSRLAAANYCDDAELLAHIKIDTTHGTALEFSVDAATAEKIANAARVDADIVRSLTFPTMTPEESLLTTQIPFQHCPQCSREVLSLKHRRRAWAFDCQVCRTRLVQTLGKPGEEQISEKLMYRARRGAGMLEHAVRQRCPKQLRRTIRPAKFALSLKTIRGDPSFALQNPSVDELGKAEAQSVLRLADRRPPLPPAYESPQN